MTMLSERKPAPRTADGERTLQPVLVDHFSRDGSTLMMRLLATSPEIAVGSQYRHEQKYFAYLYRWAQLLDRREWPKDLWTGDHLASLAQDDTMPLIGPPPWLRRELLEPVPGGERISDYSFRVVWAEFSRRAVAHTREQHQAPGADVRYYAEKHLNSWVVNLGDLPPVRLLAVLRDPRDTYVSIDAYRKKRFEAGERGPVLGHRAEDSNEAWLAHYLPRQKARLRWINRALRDGTMPVFRYEDLVRDLPDQAHRLEEWLGVRLDPVAVAKDDEIRRRHATADTPESSIGRWQSEMPQELVKRLHDELGDEMKALGFDVPTAPPSRKEPALASASRRTGPASHNRRPPRGSS
jgi:Sulfotransferase family